MNPRATRRWRADAGTAGGQSRQARQAGRRAGRPYRQGEQADRCRQAERRGQAEQDRQARGPARVSRSAGVRSSTPSAFRLPRRRSTSSTSHATTSLSAKRLLPWIGRPAADHRALPEGALPAPASFRKRDRRLSRSDHRVPLVEAARLPPAWRWTRSPACSRLVQARHLELHVWGSRIETLERPDQMVLTSTPAAACRFRPRRRGGAIVRDLAQVWGWLGSMKTSGGKGLHVLVPITPTRPWTRSRSSHARSLEPYRAPESRAFMVVSRCEAHRQDVCHYLRNGRGATFVVPYLTRSRPGATVSVPLRWDEFGATSRGDRLTSATFAVDSAASGRIRGKARVRRREITEGMRCARAWASGAGRPGRRRRRRRARGRRRRATAARALQSRLRNDPQGVVGGVGRVGEQIVGRRLGCRATPERVDVPRLLAIVGGDDGRVVLLVARSCARSRDRCLEFAYVARRA